MAIVTRKVSDLTGTEAAEGEFASVIVRQHPKISDAKKLDALPTELDQFKSVGDLVVLELRMPDTTTREVFVKYTDFVKVVSDEALAKAPGTKGRQPGYRPGNGNGN